MKGGAGMKGEIHFGRRRSSSRAWPRLRPVVTICLLLSYLCCHQNQAAVAVIGQEGGQVIKPAAAIEVSLAGGESHKYEMYLGQDQFVRIIVEQKGIDVMLTVDGPDGIRRARVDRPNGTRGAEAISFITDAEGAYRLTVQSLEKSAARASYVVVMQTPRPARAEDKRRIYAETLTAEAERQRNVATAEALGQAIEGFKQALNEWQGLGETYEIALALYGLGWSHSVLCEYEDAITCFERALQLMRQLEDIHGEAIAQTGLAYAYMYLGENNKALENFLQTLDLRRLLSNARGEAVTLYAIGSVQSLLGYDRVALNYFFESLPLRRKAEDKQGEAVTLSGIGKSYRRLGDLEKARDYLAAALQIMNESGNRVGVADTLSNLGWVYYSMHAPDLALKNFQTALPLTKIVGDPGGEAMTLFGIARAEEQLNELTAAGDHMDAALKIIEGLRNKVSSQQLRASYFASVQEYYNYYVYLLMRLKEIHPSAGYDAQALQVSERARARNLLDILTESQTDINRGVDPDLITSGRSLVKQINAKMDYQLRLQNSKNPPEGEIAKANKEITALQEKYEEIQRKIRRVNPRYASLVYPTPLTLPEIQRRVLSPDAVLLEYALGSQYGYLWVVTSDSMSSLRLPQDSAAVRAGVTALVKMLTQVGGTVRSFEAMATGLSRILLPEAALSKLKDKKKVLVVADNVLQSFPFGVLAAPNASNAYVPLVVDHEIISLPSASTLAVLRQEFNGRRPAPRQAIILADPVFASDDERVKNNRPKAGGRAAAKSESLLAVKRDQSEIADALAHGDTRTRSGVKLDRLFGTRQEAIAIHRIIPTARLALDFNADLKTATSPELGEYRIIHFATHGLAPNDHPELSGVVLSLYNRQGQAQEGYLGLPIVYNLILPADLVVLSACDTGLGAEVRGEGLIGLTRGFMYAGAPRVVASLWKVRETATGQLMQRFYTAIFRKGMRPSAALSDAQASMWKEQTWTPSDWAGFMLFGEYQ